MKEHRSIIILITIILEIIGAARIDQTIDLKRRKFEDEMMDRKMHDDFIMKRESRKFGDEVYPENPNTGVWFDHETDNSFWYEDAQIVLKKKLQRSLNTGVAKNVIVFLGDGMSIPTLMATRTYLGQLEGKPGEEGSLYWEHFPYTGLSKTWCLDKQVPDSACTSTAYLGGVKTKSGTIGLNGNVVRGKCETQIKENHVDSIAQWAQDHGKGTGIVTTTRITHASPGGAYAHVAERHWESDSDVIIGGYDPKECDDIAKQLVRSSPGNNFKVVLGGGRRSFLPKEIIDEEGDAGVRSDGKNLIDEWKKDKMERNGRPIYLWNRTSLHEIIDYPEKYDHVLGLFESSHCHYHLEGSPETEPTLAEMTEAAIRVLQKDENGFFLFVEGGRIDHAHHNTFATLALDETVELAKAVEKATELTSEKDTLIITTSDHAHTMSVSGYPKRGNPINDIVGKMAKDDIPYATLTYANGPGYRPPNQDGSRYDPSEGDFENPRHMSPALAPLDSETHGGDDVAIFANGPWAHLFTGTIQQSNIPHFIGFASCIGKGESDACKLNRRFASKLPKFH
ncbi:membrane-bound alkaline phosphatase-like [Venturia canescens]|uniref:membrane-bound alkaline phosphatase-like n=1 Tax=Venturia canescens TaxID=32260 RepID=UPI001C9BF5D0|nr:membrane-bound alkaline phosphatase-like [Venturia canescens]